MKQRRQFTEEQKKAALELSVTVGLAEAGRQFDVDRTTMWRWTKQFPEFYSDVTAGKREAQKLGIATQLEALAESYAEVEFQAIERAEKLIKTADAKEAAALIKAMGSSRGVAAVNARQTRGEDVERIEHNINFPALEAAAALMLERAEQRAEPILVENVADGPE